MFPDPAATRLRYIDPSHLDGALLRPLAVRARADTPIGTFDGVVVDPAERRVHYLVVDRGWRLKPNRRLVPMPVASVDGEHNVLRLEVDDVDADEWQEFDAATFPTFSDDDLITAMFAVR
jgi:hypothetical protein